jgi:hypothetical protein
MMMSFKYHSKEILVRYLILYPKKGYYIVKLVSARINRCLSIPLFEGEIINSWYFSILMGLGPNDHVNGIIF